MQLTQHAQQKTRNFCSRAETQNPVTLSYYHNSNYFSYIVKHY